MWDATSEGKEEVSKKIKGMENPKDKKSSIYFSFSAKFATKAFKSKEITEAGKKIRLMMATFTPPGTCLSSTSSSSSSPVGRVKLICI